MADLSSIKQIEADLWSAADVLRLSANLNANQYNNQNQILAYVLNHDRAHTGRTDGMLLYAKTQEEIQPDGQMKWHDGNTIYYRNLTSIKILRV